MNTSSRPSVSITPTCSSASGMVHTRPRVPGWCFSLPPCPVKLVVTCHVLVSTVILLKVTCDRVQCGSCEMQGLELWLVPYQPYLMSADFNV